MCFSCNKTIPFLEQVKLFSETMNERFIEPAQSGKCLIVLAMDSENKNNGIQYINVLCGDDYDLSFCVASSMLKTEFMRLYNSAIEMKRKFKE